MAGRSLRDRYGRVLPYIGAERRRLLAIALLSALSAGLTALMPWPVKILVDNALGGAPLPGWLGGFADPGATSLILAAAGAMAALTILAILVENGLSWLWAKAGHRMLYALAGDLFAHLQRMSLQFHASRRVGDLLSRITGDAWCVYQLAAQLLVSPMQQVLTILAVGAAAWAMSPALSLVLLTVVPALAVSVFLISGALKGRARQLREAEAALTSFAHQALASLPLTKVYAMEAANAENFDRLGARQVVAARRSVLVREAYGLANAAALALGLAAVTFAGALMVRQGALSLGALLAFLAYVATLKGAVTQLLADYGRVRGIEASVDRVAEVLNAAPEVADTPGAIALSRPERPEIRFEGVRFAYDRSQPTLEEIDLTLTPGETVALIGPTGAGKSTLGALIPRFFDPTAGRVTLAGRDLREMTLASLRAQLALVLQEPFLLPVTVSENIALGCPGATEDQIRRAAEAAQADDFIRALPEGYATPLGEGGATLSGGQRQRIAIARALVKDAPILILDEPTSSLDVETEAQIVTALDRLMADRTTLVIAHRLSTVRRADRVVVLDSGRIVEEGPPEALLARKGAFWCAHAVRGDGAS